MGVDFFLLRIGVLELEFKSFGKDFKYSET